ncbi:MAG: tRNA glutamyl-Q(34) synthetase GluQRS [Alphaproteobacteria bacterium]|nr:tRNA glutamyl-Q(34) synthetase GluQRS [Alphaproteobacteria bacterium]
MPNESIITRFAPSPTGWLHLGHAYAALWAARLGTQFHLRIEDIDSGRCREHFTQGIYQDLAWLELKWRPCVLHQSTRLEIYQQALADLRARNLIYPCWATRSDIAAAISSKKDAPSKKWLHDPDGAPLYPHIYRDITAQKRADLLAAGGAYAWRLDMEAALATLTTPLTYQKYDPETKTCTPTLCDPRLYGDVIIARKEIPTSYHLSVVIDDAATGITHITRGQDLESATSVHRLLQTLLGLPAPLYFHHPLVLDGAGRKLSKLVDDEGFRHYRQAGLSLEAVLAKLPPPFGKGAFGDA